MDVLQKIARKRVELGLAKQPRKSSGEWTKKEHDVFLLWGEYPKGWQMIKDLILCLMLLDSLISYLGRVDLYSLMAPRTLVFVQEARAERITPSVDVSEDKMPHTSKIEAIVTAYNSEIGQTDADPFTTASGKRVREGIVANNCLPFGTKVHISGREYVVEDRMNSRYSCECFDIWMPEHSDAIKFGRQVIETEIL